MSLLNNLSVKVKMLVLPIVVVVSMVALYLLITSKMDELGRRQVNTLDAARLVQMAQKTRLSEKNYIARGDIKYVEEAKVSAGDLAALNADLETRFKAPATIAQSKRIGEFTTVYLNALDATVEAKQQQVEADRTMGEQATILLGELRSLQESQREQRAKLMASKKSKQEDIQDKSEKAMIASNTIEEMYKARVSAMKYMLNGTKEEINNFQEYIQQVIAAGETLKDRFDNKQNRAQAVRVIDSARAYEKAFQNFISSTAMIKTRETEMVDTARSLMKEATDIGESQKKKMEEVRDELEQTMIIAFVAISIFAVLISLLIMRAIIGAVSALQAGLLSFFAYLNRETSSAERVALDSRDEFGEHRADRRGCGEG